MTTLQPTTNELQPRYTYVSTGELPPGAVVQAALDDAHGRYRTVDDGRTASLYPALARVPPNLFGICVAAVDGHVAMVGDTEYPFSIMSVSKPFVFALVCAAIGAQAAREKIGVNATGLPFNSVTAIETRPDHLTNPMVNAGALAVASLVPGATLEDKWQFIHEGLSRFVGRPLAMNEEVYASATSTNHRNRAIARILYDYGRLYFGPEETTELYTRQCSLNVTARDLAVMATTLANGGLNPLTGDQVVKPDHCRYTLAVMTTAGMYEASGDWLFDMGLPGKSGIGGGLITVAPGKGGLGVFSPPLDVSGNSVRGQLAAKFLSESLGLNLFASVPVTPPED
jgi:glutaminase